MKRTSNLRGVQNATWQFFARINKRVLSTLAVFIFVLAQLSAQDGTKITGNVTDPDGQPLPGVAVLLKSTTNGTITDIDGNYSINNVPSDGILVFSFIGMMSKEIEVGGKTIIDLTLIPDIEMLGEVIAIGYGTSTKKKLVGAVSSVNAEDLENIPVASAAEALQGRAAGVIVNSYGGGPGATPKISIRGDGNPLYVVDGIPLESDDNFTFASMNVNDIESISFLKDASACAVYGAQAADGIVLVTTKKGSKGEMRVNYSTDFRWVTPTIRPEKLDAVEYANNINEAYEMEGGVGPYTPGEIDTIARGLSPILYPNTDWYQLMLNNYATEQSHNVSLSGGNEKADYYVGMKYFDQGSLLKTDQLNLNRFNLRSNVTAKFDEIGLRVGVNLSASLENLKTPPPYGNMWTNIYYAKPNIYAFNPEDGSISAETGHPMEFVSESAGYEFERQKYVNSQLNAKWEVPWVKGLRLGGLVNYRDEDRYDKIWYVASDQYSSTGELKDKNPYLEIQSAYGHKINYEANISYNNTFLDVHTIELTGVYVQNYRYEEELLGKRSFDFTGVDQLFAGGEDINYTNGAAREVPGMGYVGRFKYDYASKYIVEFNCRYDGSHGYPNAAEGEDKALGIFPAGPRWGFFPSFSGSWVASEENFMQGLKNSNILNMLKFRGSYGTTGQIRNRYSHLTNYKKRSLTDEDDQWDPRVMFVANDVLIGGFYEPNLPSVGLSWYTRKSYNYGLDFATLGNQLEGSVDYFYDRTSGYSISPKNINMELIGLPAPKVLSDSTAKRRHGLEFNLRYKKRIGEVSFDVGVNYTHYNELWERNLDANGDNYLVIEPDPRKRLQQRKDSYGLGYEADGLYQTEEELLVNPRNTGARNIRMGDVKYVDINGDGQITTEDKVNLGLPEFPHDVFGLDFNVDYKGFFLGALITGTGERLVKFDWRSYLNKASDIVFEARTDYWTPENTDARFPRPSAGISGESNNNAEESTFWLLNGQYIRLKSLNLGYDLMKLPLMQNQNYISGCKLVLSGLNLITFSETMDYFDPEGAKVQRDSGEYSSSASVGYPVAKIFSVGLNVQF